MVRDPDSGVRRAAIKALKALPAALASSGRPEALPLLRELTKEQAWDWDVRKAAIKALASFSKEEALLLLRQLAFSPKDKVAADAVHYLDLYCSREELEAFLNRHDQELCAGALAALDELLYMPGWMKPKDR